MRDPRGYWTEVACNMMVCWRDDFQRTQFCFMGGVERGRRRCEVLSLSPVRAQRRMCVPCGFTMSVTVMTWRYTLVEHIYGLVGESSGAELIHTIGVAVAYKRGGDPRITNGNCGIYGVDKFL